MAKCVMSVVHDTDEGGLLPVTACVVHGSYSPCPHDGEPALSGMVQANAVPSRDAVVLFWWRRTLGQRTLVLHFGSTAGDDESTEEHDYEGTGCWCSPELLPASPEPIPRPRPGAGVWPL